MKKIALIVYVLASFGIVATMVIVMSAVIFDNSELRPSSDHVTDYISPTSRYAVRTLYDDNESPIDIVIVDAKSGVSVAGISQDAYSYEISEISSTIKFILRDNEGVETGVYEFDTKKGEWINLPEISDEPSSYNEKKNDSINSNIKK